MQQVFFTIKEVARRLDVSEKTVYRLCWSGALPYIRVGSRIRIAESDANDIGRPV